MLSQSERDHIQAKVNGWKWVTQQFAEARARVTAERERLLGPDRGE